MGIKNKKTGRAAGVFTIVVGILLVLTGVIIKIPADELSTYSFMADECSIIEEYVGGDAYNYIIGAALVSGHIAGAEIQKAIFISVGLLLICAGCIVISLIPQASRDNNTEKSTEELNNDNRIDNDVIEVNSQESTSEDITDELQEWKTSQISKAQTALIEGKISEEKYNEYVKRVNACKHIPVKKS